MVNGGQSCIAAKRFMVVEAVREAFEQAVVEQMKSFTLGDPGRSRKPGLARWKASRRATRSHDRSARAWPAARGCCSAARSPDRPGAWYPATVLTDVRPGQPVHDDEVFGPVAAIIAAKDEADAIRIANDSPFGLGSARC